MTSRTMIVLNRMDALSIIAASLSAPAPPPPGGVPSRGMYTPNRRRATSARLRPSVCRDLAGTIQAAPEQECKTCGLSGF
jgi:hypothetical protein